MTTSRGTQEIGVGELPGEAMASRGDTEKSPSTAAYKAGAWGRHGARPSQRGGSGGRRENQANKTSGVQGHDGGREAS